MTHNKVHHAENLFTKIIPQNFFTTLFVALAVIAAVVFFARPTTSDAAATPDLQIAKVCTGDLVVTASGAGTVVPASQLDLGFGTSGVLTELNIAVGDSVQASQVLASDESSYITGTDIVVDGGWSSVAAYLGNERQNNMLELIKKKDGVENFLKKFKKG